MNPRKHYDVESFTGPGFTLADHEKRDEVRSLLKKRWDYVILQEQSSSAFAGQTSLDGSFRSFLPLVSSTGAKVIIVMTWADRGCFSDQCLISQAYRRTGRQLNISVAPAGDLFFYVQQVNPGMLLYESDGHHPFLNGAYLYALTLYTQISSEKRLPAVDLQEPKFLLNSNDARQLARYLSEWQSISRIRPEYSEESKDGCTDIASYWTANGQPAKAEPIFQRRVDALRQLFTAKDASKQTARALVNLAEAQYKQQTPDKLSLALSNYASAEDSFKRLEGPDGHDVVEIERMPQRIKSPEKR